MPPVPTKASSENQESLLNLSLVALGFLRCSKPKVCSKYATEAVSAPSHFRCPPSTNPQGVAEGAYYFLKHEISSRSPPSTAFCVATSPRRRLVPPHHPHAKSQKEASAAAFNETYLSTLLFEFVYTPRFHPVEKTFALQARCANQLERSFSRHP